MGVNRDTAHSARVTSMTERTLLPLKRFCAALGISTSTGRRWIKQGRLAYTRLGSTDHGPIYVPRSELARVGAIRPPRQSAPTAKDGRFDQGRWA